MPALCDWQLIGHCQQDCWEDCNVRQNRPVVEQTLVDYAGLRSVALGIHFENNPSAGRIAEVAAEAEQGEG